jgi:hypothetical protein
MSDHKDIVLLQEEAPPPPNNGIQGRDERVVEYLRQRLASVIASGSAAAMEPDVNVNRSRFSEDLEDENWQAYGGSDREGSKAAYPNIRAEAWDESELDPAWIIDRYCSWQEEDLEDALMDEEEGREVNQLLSSDWKEAKDENNMGNSDHLAPESANFNPESKGSYVPRRRSMGFYSQYLDSYTVKRMARIAKTLPVFTLPMRLSQSPSPLPSPRSASMYNSRLSTSQTLVEAASPSTPPILSPRMPAHEDVPEPIMNLDLLHDASFHATTAFLLGPDFGCDVHRMARRFQQGQESVREATNDIISPPAQSESKTEPGDGSTSRPLSTNDDSVLKILDSLDMSWKVFRSKTSVQKYLNTSVPPNDPWDFGICFDRGNGSQHCAVMHAQGMKRTYTDHTVVREGVPAGNDVLAPGCKHIFWWCRPHPQWKEANSELRARAKNLEEHYEEAKKRIDQFKEKKAGWMKVALLQSYARLLEDLPERERTTGRFSIHSMNTVLQLAEIAELSERLSEADDWNGELVRRRAKRLGRKSIHTCHARYRHAQLLYNMEKYDQAGDVSKENLAALKDFDNSYPLVAKQNILACAIALKRKRIEQAVEVVEHLWSLESNHPGDLKTKEFALEILHDGHSFRREYAKAEGFKRKQIEMYEAGYGKGKDKGLCYYHLAVCLRRQEKFNEGLEASKKAISVYKECLGDADQGLFDAYQLLGNCLFDLRDWNKARFYIDKAIKGYTGTLGSKADKTEKARETLKVLEKNAQIKQGLAERLAQHQEKNKLKRKF